MTHRLQIATQCLPALLANIDAPTNEHTDDQINQAVAAAITIADRLLAFHATTNADTERRMATHTIRNP